MPEILLVTALHEEQIRLPEGLFHTSTLVTGMGKVPCTYSLARVLQVARPRLVLNVGTVGTVRYSPGDVLVCRDFVDRNLLGIQLPGVETISKAPSPTAMPSHHRLSRVWKTASCAPSAPQAIVL